jgi:MarR family transcriptional regulator, organic hydroperoxide resistance regulator
MRRHRGTTLGDDNSYLPMKTRRNIEFAWQAPSLAHRLREVTRLFRHVFHQTIHDLDITDGEWACLRLLWDEDGISQTEMSDRLDMTKAAVVLWVNVLERDALAKRKIDRSDGRRFRIFLTAKGRRMEAQLQPTIRAIHEKVLANCSITELQAFGATLTRIQRALGALSQQQQDRRPNQRTKATASSNDR